MHSMIGLKLQTKQITNRWSRIEAGRPITDGIFYRLLPNISRAFITEPEQSLVSCARLTVPYFPIFFFCSLYYWMERKCTPFLESIL